MNDTMTVKDQAIDFFFNQGKNKSEIARIMDVPRTTIRRWLSGYVIDKPEDKIQSSQYKPSEIDILKDKVRQLENIIRINKKDTLSEHYIREKIIKITSQKPNPPKWLTDVNTYDSWEAVPTIFLSDLHWGEVVDPNQIGGVNEFNLEIAQKRLQNVVETTINLLDMIDGEYPGIVVALGGDMLSGDIHEELSESNEMPMMPVFLDLYEKMVWTLQQFADQYGNVFVPCVTGNHSRTTRKPRAKSRNYTNFDWLLYTMLNKYFENDDRIEFCIPDGPDALYKVYNTKYLLTHGDQFRGGDGMIGALGCIIRGDHKKRSRNGQIGLEYDCMLLGHWHQLIQMQRVVVNGSLKGYDEYANANNFGYEPARQALWLTHPEHGIIMSMPVNVDDKNSSNISSDWISWKK